jgi:hypothetical protein
LNVIRVQKKRIAAEFVNADFKRNPRARGRFRENHRPGLPRERFVLAAAALGFQRRRILHNRFHVGSRQFFQTQKMFH